jgi:hypothetical protein
MTPMFVTRTTIGWQTMLADLSLILFMVTAAAMADAPARPQSAPPAAHPAPMPPAGSTAQSSLADPAQAEPLAIWREAPGAPALSQWLTNQQPDARLLLTITLRYRPTDQAAALARGGALAHSAGAAGNKARIILEPAKDASGIEAMAALAYDRGPGV